MIFYEETLKTGFYGLWKLIFSKLISFCGDLYVCQVAARVLNIMPFYDVTGDFWWNFLAVWWELILIGTNKSDLLFSPIGLGILNFHRFGMNGKGNDRKVQDHF